MTSSEVTPSLQDLYNNFSAAGVTLDEAAAQGLARAGIIAPTAVQKSAFPVILKQQSAIIQAPTGTGKTLSYLLPLLQRLREDPACRVLILAPSPELALQILHTVEGCKVPGLSICSLVNSGNIERQKDKLKKKPRLVVGTPGRVLEMIDLRKLVASTITTLVLDEADQTMIGDNENKLRKICSRPEVNWQIILASATIGLRAELFAKDTMPEEHVWLRIVDTQLPRTLQHHVLMTDLKNKEQALVEWVESLGKDRALVFVNKPYTVAKLYHALTDAGIRCLTISAERGKQARQEALEGLKKGSIQVIVATDTAARGLDIKQLYWVVSFDVPPSKEAYLHRAGRTARAGKKGACLTLATSKDSALLQSHARALDIEFTPLRR